MEQPLPADDDAALASIARPIPVCADESVHDRASLAALVGKYDAVNIKLDKTGGLTEALAMAAEAERLGFGIMVGCMVATSLSMAPAMLVAQRARVVDLDGPLLLARDREHGLRYEGSLVYPATPALWGWGLRRRLKRAPQRGGGGGGGGRAAPRAGGGGGGGRARTRQRGAQTLPRAAGAPISRHGGGGRPPRGDAGSATGARRTPERVGDAATMARGRCGRGCPGGYARQALEMRTRAAPLARGYRVPAQQVPRTPTRRTGKAAIADTRASPIR